MFGRSTKDDMELDLHRKKAKFSDFLNRQNQFLENKRDLLENNQQPEEKNLFHPKVNPASEFLMETHPDRAGENQDERIQRLYQEKKI